jgi:hypothetical protein
MKKSLLMVPLLAGVSGLSSCKKVEKNEEVTVAQASASSDAISAEDDAFLADLERRCYRYFEETADPDTGLIADRWKADGSDTWDTAGIAATGFGLTGHAIAVKRGWITEDEGIARSRKVLLFMRDKVEHKRGFYYQFINRSTGEREPNSPASTIDNALFVVGALTTAEAFPDSDIPAIANEIYNRMDWAWMLDGNDFLQYGWKPEEGFLKAEWKTYCEHMVLLLLAVGAEKNPIPPACWDAWERGPLLEFQGEKFAHYPPLFIHQYSQAYFDFQNYKDKHLDYWRNSQLATLAQIDYMKRLAEAYPDQMGHYSDDLWGLTASDGPDGYKDWGAPYKDPRLRPWRGVDGTVVPSAPGGSLAICLEPSIHTLRVQKERFGDKVYGRYGFANAHNPRTGWVSQYCLAIDTGITLLMAENTRSGYVWNTFMKHPAAVRAFERAGFKNIQKPNK